ncbi:unnamed protein product [Adineta steineri]|uniref:Uncharacterized protein n=1 Tax=Adineta steineri TaxID=433720 RepID=A0A819BDM5_9BILA|nr:unnamed protein product [Adineta steineri]CAF3794953.1 unnamed protein product [Adineta steineri]
MYLERIHAQKCYGHVLTYYEKNRSHILYTLGARKHIIEKKIEEVIDKFHFKTIIYFLFIMESFYTREFVISAYIICRRNDNCALNYMIDLVKSYRQNKNPIDQLTPLLYGSEELSELNCYNSETKHIESCFTQQYSTCMINNTDILEQKCYTDSNIRLEYEFMIKLSKKNSISKIFELVICNIIGCNDELVLRQSSALDSDEIEVKFIS